MVEYKQEWGDNMAESKYVCLLVRLRKRHKKDIEAAAKATGESVQVYIRNAVQQRMEREPLKRI
jgi:predicted HicB family RNase H-like nuclease